ncbi:MAG: polysaccharide lyase family protein [Acidobacteriaceae bacterium]
MTKGRLLFVSLFLTLAVVLTYGVTAQQAAPAKPAAKVQPAAQAKPAGHVLPKVAKVTVNDPVTLTDNGDSWTLDNGIVKMTVLKSNGNMTTVYYKGIDIPNSRSEYWEQTPAGTVTAKVTIDPSTNGGQRAEVSVKGVNPGTPGVRGGGGGPALGAGAPGAGGRGARGGSAPGSGAPGGAPAAGSPTTGASGAPGGFARGAGGPGAPGAGGPFGPGAARAGVPSGAGRGGMDIEVRYALERGTSGFYTYAEYTHPASYPPAGEGESRFILQMNPTFNWISVDKDRNQLMIANQDQRSGVVIHAKEQSIILDGVYKNSVEHKYSYCAVIDKLTAWGWSSTKDHIGVYFINPSNEYIGGGPEKLDLVAHMGATLLDYWTSGHYAGGSVNNIPNGESWKHVVGPIFVYFNSLDDAKDPSQTELDKLKATSGSGMPAVPAEWHDNAMALWDDAVAKSKSVKAAWPYSWVEGVDYPHKDGRATVTGQLILDDPQAVKKTLPHLTVGLAHPNYTGAGAGFLTRGGNGNIVTWPHDGDYYQFWVDGAADGRFTIPNVRPGKYTLHAFADGVLGEYAKADITVEAGKKIDLGKLDWQPVRFGKQIWEIGYPDRTSDKFLKGDGANYWLWGWPLRYAGLFPNDVTYTIGKSNPAKDWFFEEVPHSTTTAWLNPAAKDPYNQRFGWVNTPPSKDDPWREWGRGRATTWTVKFNMSKATQGTAVLRIALAGADGGGLTVGVNGQQAGSIRPVSTNALRYNTDKGVWYQYIVKFDASLMKAGTNEMTFTVPAGDVTTGVVWDYVRLELNDGSKAYPTPPDNQRPDYPTLN